MLPSQVGHINIGKSSEAREEEEVTDELKTRDRQLLVGYPQDLLVGKEASIHWDEVEVEITKGILEEIASLEGIDGDSPQGLHLLDDGVVGTQSHRREVQLEVLDDGRRELHQSDVLTLIPVY